MRSRAAEKLPRVGLVLIAVLTGCDLSVGDHLDGGGGQSPDLIESAPADGGPAEPADAALPDAARPSGPPPPAPGTVDVWLTTNDRASLLAKQTPLPLVPAQPGGGEPTIDVDTTKPLQIIDGFGAALTDSSGWMLTHNLSEAQRRAVMAKLFDPASGIGISYVRLPMGACDFSLGDYTYDDLPADATDLTMAHFSIDHDRAYLIPRLQEARALNPALKILGSPWSAPAWMKSSGSINRGTLLTKYFDAYALYFTRFVEGYTQAGVPIDAITIQNEPHNEQGYPTMRMEPNDQATFIAGALGPAFAKAGITTKILVWDHNWDEPNYPLQVLASAARPFVAGTAFHCYGGDVSAQSQVQSAYPDKDLYFTECTGINDQSFADTLTNQLSDLIIGATRNWARTVLLWNLALDDNSGPQNRGCPFCRGVVTVHGDGSFDVNPEYFSIGHASRFVYPGARRVPSNTLDGSSITDVSFVNPNGVRALVALNTGGKVTIRVRTKTHEYHYAFPGGAAATFLWLEE
jgi:glucosylceramidase